MSGVPSYGLMIAPFIPSFRKGDQVQISKTGNIYTCKSDSFLTRDYFGKTIEVVSVDADHISYCLVSALTRVSNQSVVEKINNLIKGTQDLDTSLISDGYHTFGELYAHRNLLFIAIMNRPYISGWKSKLHSDGTCYEGYFIAGLYYYNHPEEGYQITYHLPLDLWDLCKGLEMPNAPEWDGHNSDDVLERLKQAIL